MFKPRLAALPLTCLALLSVCFSNSGANLSVYAQQQSPTGSSEERERGVELYLQGDLKEAIKALRAAVKKSKTDAAAWHVLGLAYYRNGRLKDARKAFEAELGLRPASSMAHMSLAYTLLDLGKLREAEGEALNALALDSNNAEAHFIIGAVYWQEGAPKKALKEADAALKIRDDLRSALLLRINALVGIYAAETPLPGRSAGDPPPTEEARAAYKQRLAEAADDLDKFLKLEPNYPNAPALREQLETLRFYAGQLNATDDADKVFGPHELTTRARILSKPEPQYTEAAREAGISGTIVLRAVLAADGKVKHILVLRSLPQGLTEKVVEVARRIKFVPATKDGRPASQFVQIEYNFNVY